MYSLIGVNKLIAFMIFNAILCLKWILGLMIINRMKQCCCANENGELLQLKFGCVMSTNWKATGGIHHSNVCSFNLEKYLKALKYWLFVAKIPTQNRSIMAYLALICQEHGKNDKAAICVCI